MISLLHIILLACTVLTAESIILGRRRSGQSWGWSSWSNPRGNSWGEPEKYRGWESKSEGWGWNWGGRDRWGSNHQTENWSNSDRWGSERWKRRNENSWSRWSSPSRNSWDRHRNRQRSRSRSRSHSRSHSSSSSSSSSTTNSWYYQMVCKNSYPPLKQSNGSPYYCSWYSPCPQNGGSSYWYSYKYICQNVNEGAMGLCCVDAGEITSIYEL